MLVKTFKATDMSEALRMVKAEMGSDAMILSSRKERRKGILGIFSKPFFEVTAAIDPRPAPKPVPPPPQREERELTTKEEFQKSMLGPLARELRELREKVEKLATREVPPPQPAAFKAEPPESKAGANNGNGGIARAIPKEDMEELKQYLLNAIKVKEKPEAVPVAFPAHRAEPEDVKILESELQGVEKVLANLATELHDAGIEKDAVGPLLECVRPMAETTADQRELRLSLIDAFSSVVKTAGPLRMKKNGPRIIALVGPTGVGKTTTTAKLAAMYAMHKGAKVALVTTDNFRVGAFEQLKTYSKIMGVPLEIAVTSQDLAKATETHADKDLIIIDTAGRSPKDHGRLDELKALLDSGLDIEMHLCLSATTRDKELADAITNFSVLPISSLLFTKLDEAENLGSIVNTHHRSKLPLSYFTNGQMVPEDIVVATPRKLANLVMKENV
ncbi:flagellar biosynthesis protein FlhF [Geobacter sp. OR-1]|uniref:flagellar biosynthesis protein FlhF n=1 Tax=Geobacter sp. OR-1 TaxID=1266765 RepID=UPI000541B5C8|nr:flagellar biosynthesis protein FlhF [Geobacter sp. OR-1]GAM09679.1 flagellar biosynthesis protein FlhF [Geobacter sp. OR-1]